MAKTKLTKQELPKGTLHQVDLNDIIPSKTNPRKEFKEDALNDLAASIKSVGLMQPLVLHKAADEYQFGLISGERRFKAAKIAGLTSVPCMVYDKLSDEIVLEMQITENLQRQDINAMEESDAFQQLISMGMATAEVIADKLGKSTKYVYDRIILQKVVPEVQSAIREGKLTITHGKQFARLPFFEQAKVVESIDMEEISVADLREEISDMIKLKLDKAVFDITSKSLVKKAGACTSCNKRSGCNLVLFDDVKEDDICFDTDCWNSKVDAHIDFTIDQLKGEGKEVVLISTNFSTKLNALSNNEWNAFWEDGDDEGETSNYYGIVVELGTYTTGYKIGQVIKLQDDRAEKAERAAVNNTKSPLRSTSNNSYEPTPDYEAEFCQAVLEAAYSNGLNFETKYEFLRERLAIEISNFDDEVREWFLKLIKWDPIPEDCDDERKFIESIIDEKRNNDPTWSIGGESEITDLLYWVDLVGDYGESYLDFTEFDDIQRFDESVPNINFNDIANQINTKYGKTVLTLPVRETES